MTWASHVKKSFMELIEVIYDKDKILLDSIINTHNVSRKPVFVYPFGFCINFDDYDVDKDFSVKID